MKNRIKTIRQNSEMSQQAFGDKLGLSRNFIWQLESGERSPSDRTITDICREFRVNEIWLRTGDGEPFQELSEGERITAFVMQTLNGTDEVKRAMLSMLATLDEDGWRGLEMLYKSILSQNTGSSTDDQEE